MAKRFCLPKGACMALWLALASMPAPVIPAYAQGSSVGSGEHRSSVPRHEAVRVQSGRVVLAATLVVPVGEGPHPAAVLVSGAQAGVFEPSYPLVQRLAGDGIAVLVLGKRGVGESTGSWKRESFEQRAEDVERAVELLRNRPEIDAQQVGLIGHSQGGWIVQLVAAADPGIAFVAMLAGPGQTVFDQILTDEQIHLERRGTPPEAVDRRIRRLRKQLGVLTATAPVCRALRAHYLCHIIRFDPTPALEQIRMPVLAVYGELDPEVPPVPNVELVSSALARAGNRDVTIHVFPQANHQFWIARTGLRDEYVVLERQFVPGYLDMVSGWVRNHAGLPRPSGSADGAEHE
jgi:uncharacterized protein